MKRETETQRKKERLRERETETQRDRDRQTDRQTDKQTNRQAGRETCTCTSGCVLIYLRYEHQHNIGVNLHAVDNMWDEETLIQLQKHLLLMILQ